MKKIAVITLSLILIIIIWIGLERDVYRLGKNNIITIWKTYGNRCYVVSGKYIGLIPPTLRNHMVMTNRNQFTIFLTPDIPNGIIVQDLGRTIKFMNYDSHDPFFVDYYSDSSRLNKILFQDSVINVNRLKKHVIFFDANIKEGYVMDMNGRTL